MTDYQKEAIKDLRMRGMGYGKIAERMGMKRVTVKAYCRQHGLAGKGTGLTEAIRLDEEYLLCKNCGQKVWQTPKRKRKLFCCDACRYQWWNRHPYMINRKAYYDIVCLHCGKRFRVYGDSRRKYCSHECYIEHRFG